MREPKTESAERKLPKYHQGFGNSLQAKMTRKKKAKGSRSAYFVSKIWQSRDKLRKCLERLEEGIYEWDFEN